MKAGEFKIGILWERFMKVMNTLFLNHENGSLILYHLIEHKKIKLYLNKPWNNFPFSKTGYLTSFRIINPYFVEENEYETTPDTLIILNPDVLITSRTIASASDCICRIFVDYILGESTISLPLIRGSIIHDAFSNMISRDSEVLKAFETSVEKFSFPLSYLSVDLEHLAQDLIPVLEGLAYSRSILQKEDIISEMTFLSPLFGILGRIDYWAPNELFELKTGKKVPSKEQNTWFSDLMQTVTYMHGLSPTPKAVSKAYVIYSGLGTPAFRQTTLNLNLLQSIHMARNYSYLIQYEGYIPPELNTNKCIRCFQKDKCNILLKIFNEDKSYPAKPFHYLTHFLNLVRLEHLKDRQNFAFLWKFSPSGRVKTGKAIPNLKLLKREDDNHVYSCQNISELKRGEPVIISQGNIIIDTTTITRISEIDRTKVSLSSQSQLPNNIFLDGYSSDFNFRQLNKNIFDLSFGSKKNHKTHDFVILGKKPTFTAIPNLELEELDQSQQEAIQLALNTRDYCLIQGPAGTGKTYTIAKLVEILRNKGQRILLTAYTNTAVDNMIKEYLKKSKIPNSRKEIVRLGVEQAIDKELTDLLLKNLNLTYQDLMISPIVATTTITLSRAIYDDLYFDTVVIDEASQMPEPYILSAITKGEKFILVGDDKQLSPLVKSSQAEKLGFNISLFERLRKMYPESSALLRYQYRMHDNLLHFSNFRFYDNQVQTATPEISKQLLWDILPSKDLKVIDKPIFQTILDPDQPLIYVGAHTNFDRKKRINSGESEIIREIISYYLKIGIKNHHIGVIAPFRGQVAEIIRRINPHSGIIVDTIDRFQGSDKEIIILSLCTLSSPHILEDERRMNVALTRAKKKLIIVGNIPSKLSVKLFQELFSFIHKNYSVVIMNQRNTDKSILESQIEQDKGTKVESDFSYQSLTKDDINEEYIIGNEHRICVLCQEFVSEKLGLSCPVCNQAYHEDHLRTWLESNDFCVTCQSKILLT
ncbi:MAG: AAA domain-containing protein [Candidatus Hodarchaeota archaeon]